MRLKYIAAHYVRHVVNLFKARSVWGLNGHFQVHQSVKSYEISRLLFGNKLYNLSAIVRVKSCYMCCSKVNILIQELKLGPLKCVTISTHAKLQRKYLFRRVQILRFTFSRSPRSLMFPKGIPLCFYVSALINTHTYIFFPV